METRIMPPANFETDGKKTLLPRAEMFNSEYYENGVAEGISGYQDYRWMPERTLVFAHKIIKRLGLRDGERVLDYGCAKGFMVHALRLLDIEAYGCDISKYAIEHAHPGIEKYLKLMEEGGNLPFEDKFFREVIAKDVFEHIPGETLDKTLQECARVSKRLFSIVPLGDGERYFVPSYENDITHIHRQPREWWEEKFDESGWKVESFSYLVPGMKQNYANYPRGNGFFFLKRE